MSECKCCTLLRGPKTIQLVTKTRGASLNFSLDGVNQFSSVSVEDGEKTVEIYHCADIIGFKNAYVTILGVKSES